MKMRTLAAALLPAMLLLGACASAPKQAKKEQPPDPPLTGRQAFQKMFIAARGWSVDAQPLQLQSYNLQAVKTEKGTAGAWTATFVSAKLRKSRLYTWSAIEAEGNLHQGVFASQDQDWAGPSGQSNPFEIAAIRVDSDAALETAMKQKETVAFTKANPDKPMLFILEKTPRFPDLAWRVGWGESVGTSEYTVFVDASTGAFLEKVR